MKTNTIIFGCDPEFFFTKGGKITGAEKFIPKDGLVIDRESVKNPALQEGDTKIVIDGVQAELNPRADTCRARLGNELSACFRKLYEELKPKLDFSGMIEISKDELDGLSEKARQFGCAPSNNVYGKSKMAIKDASKFYKRSAGGHIHLGGIDSETMELLHDPKRIMPLLDIIVGNTCVLLDTDPANAERRKVYGRAGEYRLPKHGIEYRTLSNFWLRSYQLFSMVMGLARQAVWIGLSKEDTNAILQSVNIKDVQKAINENDVALAQDNFMKVLPVLLSITGYSHEVWSSCPINKKYIEEFLLFTEKGLDYWFKDDILEHWAKLPEGHDLGFENFLQERVHDEKIKLNYKLSETLTKYIHGYNK